MTKSQRLSILTSRWPAACRAQGWNPRDRELRLQVIGDAVGRQIGSMTELDNAKDIDLVYAHLGMLADNVSRTAETLPAGEVEVSAGAASHVRQDDTPGYRRRLFWLIRRDARKLGGEPYVTALARDRFHLADGLSTIEDLTTQQLHQLMVTIHARLNKRARQVEPPVSEEVENNCPF